MHGDAAPFSSWRHHQGSRDALFDISAPFLDQPASGEGHRRGRPSRWFGFPFEQRRQARNRNQRQSAFHRRFGFLAKRPRSTRNRNHRAGATAQGPPQLPPPPPRTHAGFAAASRHVPAATLSALSFPRLFNQQIERKRSICPSTII